MNQAFEAHPSSKTGAWSRLIILLAGETLLFGLFVWLASSPDRRIDFGDLGMWFEATAPLDVLIAVAILIGALASFWLFASTVVYAGARLMHLSQVEDGLRRFTLPAVRRVVDGALAISIAGTAVLGGGRLAGAQQVDRPAVEQTADPAVGSAPLDYRFAYQQAPGNDIPQPAGDGEAEAPAPSNVIADNTGGGTLVRPPAPGQAAQPAPAPVGEEGDIPQPAGDGETTPEPPAPAPTPDPVPSPAEPPPAEPTVGGEVLVRPPAPNTGGVDTGSGSNTAQIPGADTSTPTPAPNGSDQSGGTTTAPTATPGTYTVQEGDNFWSIAAAQVQNKLGREPSNAEIAAYWEVLIEANRANISSGNPSLIFPGEQFTLPPVP